MSIDLHLTRVAEIARGCGQRGRSRAAAYGTLGRVLVDVYEDRCGWSKREVGRGRSYRGPGRGGIQGHGWNGAGITTTVILNVAEVIGKKEFAGGGSTTIMVPA